MSSAEPSRASVDKVNDVLLQYRKTAIVVQGHTDATGSETHNERLSRRRADAVVAYMIGAGIDTDRVTSIGYGEAHPVATNDTEAGRQLNRRVDLLLKAKAT